MNKDEEANLIKVGEKIKRIRLEKGLSLTDLAEKTGFSSAVLSQIENHLISPPLGALIKLARGLGVGLSYFFTEGATSEPFIITRKDERRPVSRFESKEGVKYGYYYESLARDKKDRHMEPFLVTLEPATVKDKKLSTHEGEEFIFVLEGAMEVRLGEHWDILYPGDCIYYDATIPHLVSCHKDQATKILAVIYAPVAEAAPQKSKKTPPRRKS